MPDKFHDYGSNYYPYIDKMLNKFHELSMHLLTTSKMIKTQLTVSLHIHMHSLTIFIPILS